MWLFFASEASYYHDVTSWEKELCILQLLQFEDYMHILNLISLAFLGTTGKVAPRKHLDGARRQSCAFDAMQKGMSFYAWKLSFANVTNARLVTNLGGLSTLHEFRKRYAQRLTIRGCNLLNHFQWSYMSSFIFCHFLLRKIKLATLNRSDKINVNLFSIVGSYRTINCFRSIVQIPQLKWKHSLISCLSYISSYLLTHFFVVYAERNHFLSLWAFVLGKWSVFFSPSEIWLHHWIINSLRGKWSITIE